MAIRTTAADVRAILGPNYDGKTTLTPFITTANIITDRVAADAILRERTLTDAELELIERWLSAHYYTMMDPLYASKGIGKVSGSFAGKTGMHLEASRYGLTAMEIDHSGALQAIGGSSGRTVVSLSWLGEDLDT